MMRLFDRLRHLRAADAAGVHDVAREGAEHRPQALDHGGLAADEAEERALVRGLAAAAHRRVDHVDAALRALTAASACTVFGCTVLSTARSRPAASPRPLRDLRRELAQLMVVADADQHHLAQRRERRGVGRPWPRRAPRPCRSLRSIDVVWRSVRKPFARQVPDHRQAHAPRAHTPTVGFIASG